MVPDGSTNTHWCFARSFRWFRDGSGMVPRVSPKAYRRCCHANMRHAQRARKPKAAPPSSTRASLTACRRHCHADARLAQGSDRSGAAPPQLHAFRFKCVAGTTKLCAGRSECLTHSRPSLGSSCVSPSVIPARLRSFPRCRNACRRCCCARTG